MSVNPNVMKEMLIKNHGKGKIAINEDYGPIIQFRPTELHLKEDGSLTNEPSFAVVMTRPDAKGKAVGQISLEMLNEALGELGYTIIPLAVDLGVDTLEVGPNVSN
jgi:hypothetical protein